MTHFISDLLLVCSTDEAEHFLQPMLNAALDVVLPLAQVLDPTDTGVVFMFWRIGDDGHRPLVVLRGGNVSPEKDGWYMENAMRKLAALADNPGIVSTAEVANPTVELFGGGTRLFDGRLAYISAGLNSWFDEMVDCIMAWSIGHTTVAEMRRVAEISKNPHLNAYLDDLEGKLRRVRQ